MDLFLLTGWVLGVLLIPVVAYRRNLTSALSWIALLLLLPWLGPLLYLLLAEHRRTRRVRKRRLREETHRSRVLPAVEKAWRLEPRGHGSRGEGLAALSRRLGGFEALGGNRVEVLEGGPTATERLVSDIDAARNHVHLLFYIVESDRTGERVSRALVRAARRGVHCRVLADAVGSWRFHRYLAPGLEAAGVEVWKGLTMPSLLRRLRPLDLRNHRKLAVVDGRVAYAGSMNVQDDHDPPAGQGGTRWHDVVVRLTGPVCLQLQLVFQEDWEDATKVELAEDGLYPRPAPSGHVAIQVVPSGPTSRGDTLRDLLVAALELAEERVVITTPYLIPDEPTRVALRLARARGVEVDVIVPAVSDIPFATLAGRSYYAELLEEGIRIHEHRRGFLHAKTLTVDDDVAVLGSANFDRRSFFLNFELSLVLYGEEAVGQVERMHARYHTDSHELDLREWRRRPLVRRLVEDVARLFSPLL